MKFPLFAVTVGVALALAGLFVEEGWLALAGLCFALGGFFRALAVTADRRARRPDPYAIGYAQVEETREDERSPEQLRKMIGLAEQRVEEMRQQGFESGEQAARGILDSYRAALERAEKREADAR